MTQKLYYDHNLGECEATVLACREGKDGFEILLDQTVIYPEGGGQLSDTGSIGGARVSYAFEEGHDVWHRCTQAFCAGETVRVRFDEDARRDHCQQHTGEHILSGLAGSLYGCANIGFHMTEAYVSVDFDRQLSADEVGALEIAANEAIQRDEPTQYRIVNADQLETIELRKRARGLTGEIRIVYAGGVDSCTCCGTHCVRAGEVGVLKVISHQNYKGGTRIFFLCGMRAVRSMTEDAALVEALAKRFSTKQEQVLQAVVRQGEELAETKRVLKKRTDDLFAYRAEAVRESAAKAGDIAVIVRSDEGLGMNELGFFAEKICETGKNVCVLFSEKDGQLLYRLARTEGLALSMKEVCQAVNAATGGKGGGRDDSAQGSAAVRSDLREICVQLETYLKSRLKAGKTQKTP